MLTPHEDIMSPHLFVVLSPKVTLAYHQCSCVHVYKQLLNMGVSNSPLIPHPKTAVRSVHTLICLQAITQYGEIMDCGPFNVITERFLYCCHGDKTSTHLHNIHSDRTHMIMGGGGASTHVIMGGEELIHT